MKKTKFKNKYVLGEGYPWALGLGPYHSVGVVKGSVGVNYVPLKFPKELWSSKLPKYQLVLEKVPSQKKVK